MEDSPSQHIAPGHPLVAAFALGSVAALAPRIGVGEVVIVAVADGARPPHDPLDWFAAGVPVIRLAGDFLQERLAPLHLLDTLAILGGAVLLAWPATRLPSRVSCARRAT
jgi:hypothetical protein